jgi:hypothetical protein
MVMKSFSFLFLFVGFVFLIGSERGTASGWLEDLSRHDEFLAVAHQHLLTFCRSGINCRSL